MTSNDSDIRADGRKRIELLVVIVIFELLIVIVLMAFMTAFAMGAKNESGAAAQKLASDLKEANDQLKADNERAQASGRQGAANTNARALATAIQGKAITTGKYDTVLEDYAVDMGGAIPMNPCTGTTTGYSITATSSTATVAAQAGTHCGEWTPMTFSLTL